jgi:hypothetical protein
MRDVSGLRVSGLFKVAVKTWIRAVYASPGVVTVEPSHLNHSLTRDSLGRERHGDVVLVAVAVDGDVEWPAPTIRHVHHQHRRPRPREGPEHATRPGPPHKRRKSHRHHERLGVIQPPHAYLSRHQNTSQAERLDSPSALITTRRGIGVAAAGGRPYMRLPGHQPGAEGGRVTAARSQKGVGDHLFSIP